jgi:hypothetical protein
LARRIFLAPIGSERSADPRLLADPCRRANPTAQITVCRNLAEAFTNAGAEPFVVVTGSLYFVGEALEWLGIVPPSQERALNEYGGAPAGDSTIGAAAFDVAGPLNERAVRPAENKIPLANAQAGIMAFNSFDPGGGGH